MGRMVSKIVKLLLLIPAIIVLIGYKARPVGDWGIVYKKNEFNETTQIAKFISARSYDTNDGEKTTSALIMIRRNKISFWIWVKDNRTKKHNNIYIENPTAVAVRTPRGIVRFQGKRGFLDEDVDIEGREALRFFSLLKRYNRLKVSVKSLLSEYYVFDIDCRGFTKTWRKTGWR